MDFSAVDALLCPHCGLGFTAPGNWAGALSCGNGHSFDIARQGYLNLLTGHGTKFVPDTAAMVDARDTFLDAGHYDPLANALAGIVQDRLPASGPSLLVDAGTGTGWYLHRILAGFPQGRRPHVKGPAGASAQPGKPVGESPAGARRPAAVGLDISKFALRRAARRNPAAVNIVWDLWRDLPLGANTADIVLVVFAPRNPAEFARILKPGGPLVVVTPLPGHLAEIVRDTGMLGIAEDKESALIQSMSESFELVERREVVVPLQLSPADVGNVALMGPAGHHLDPSELGKRLAHLPAHTAATAAFRISVFQALVQHH